jgi:hypothetical protein
VCRRGAGDVAPPDAPKAPAPARPAKRKAAQRGGAAPAAGGAAAATADAVSGPARAEASGEDPAATKDHSAYYLMKNEPDDFSIDDLAQEPGQTTCWGARALATFLQHFGVRALTTCWSAGACSELATC